MYQVQWNKKKVKANYFVEFSTLHGCQEYINKRLTPADNYSFIRIINLSKQEIYNIK